MPCWTHTAIAVNRRKSPARRCMHLDVLTRSPPAFGGGLLDDDVFDSFGSVRKAGDSSKPRIPSHSPLPTEDARRFLRRRGQFKFQRRSAHARHR